MWLSGLRDRILQSCLVEIHAVPRGHTWKEATVSQAPWLPVRRLESPLEPDLTLSSLFIGTNSPCAVSHFPRTVGKELVIGHSVRGHCSPRSRYFVIRSYPRRRRSFPIEPSLPLPSYILSFGKRRYTKESPNNIQCSRKTESVYTFTIAARTATTLGSWCTEYAPNSWI